MGAGQDLAGAGLAGEDLPAPGFPKTTPLPSAAIEFDGIEKDYKLDDDNRLQSIHWVDAAVFANARIPLGSILSAPAAGSSVQRIRFIDKRTIEADVRDRVRLSQKTLLDRGLITILAIAIDTAVTGRIVYQLDYVNNVTKKRDKTSGTS
jgi:hypothetical protein